LHFARSKSSLMNHPLFRLWIHMSDRSVGSICTKSVTFKVLRSMDDLFIPGSTSGHAYHLMRGALAYNQDPETSPVVESETSLVQEGSWICEAALWTEWQHVGTASTSSACQLMAIDAEQMVASLGRNRLIRDITQQYAQEYHRRLAAAQAPFWPSDITVPFTDFGSIVHSMEHRLKVAIGLSSLEQLPWSFQSMGANHLREEVMKGRCAVVVNCDGSVERIVRVAALRISRKDEMVLAQMGYFQGGIFTVACTMPGTKLKRGETHQAGVARVLATRLNPLRDAVAITSFTEEDTSKYEAESLRFRVKTRYYRTVCSANVSRTYSAPVIHATRSEKVTSEVHLGEVLRNDIYVFPWDDGRQGIYTWIHERDLESLKAPRSQRHVEEWAKTLRIDEDILEDPRLWSVQEGSDSEEETWLSSGNKFVRVPEDVDDPCVRCSL